MQLACLTLGCVVSPMALQGLLQEVPVLTVDQLAHFNPKCARKPASKSPRKIVIMAVLGRLPFLGTHTVMGITIGFINSGLNMIGYVVSI